MHIALLAYGSRGDVQPCIALSVGLRRAGHTVTLAASALFAPLAAAHGLAFAPLPGDVVPFSRALAERAGRNPFAQARVMGAYVRHRRRSALKSRGQAPNDCAVPTVCIKTIKIIFTPIHVHSPRLFSVPQTVQFPLAHAARHEMPPPPPR